MHVFPSCCATSENLHHWIGKHDAEPLLICACVPPPCCVIRMVPPCCSYPSLMCMSSRSHVWLQSKWSRGTCMSSVSPPPVSSPTSAPSLSPPRSTLAAYQELQVIGEGTFGKVAKIRRIADGEVRHTVEATATGAAAAAAVASAVTSVASQQCSKGSYTDRISYPQLVCHRYTTHVL